LPRRSASDGGGKTTCPDKRSDRGKLKRSLDRRSNRRPFQYKITLIDNPPNLASLRHCIYSKLNSNAMKHRLIVCLSIMSGMLATVPVVLMLGILTGCQEPDLVKTENLNSGTRQTAMGNARAANKAPEFPDASDFVSEITNPYLNFKVGRIFYYESETEDGLETNTVEITGDIKVIMGNINATVVRDKVFLDGELIEDTFDWYAQDKDGNVWYLGEYTKEYEDGQVVSTAGSWEAGIDGAIPGLIMAANPVNGMKYRQEFLEGEAEDNAIVINTDKTVTIDIGTYEGSLETMEYSTLEHGSREHKYYSPGTGLLLEWVRSGGERVELVKIEN
jgi:hypothetical protein